MLTAADVDLLCSAILAQDPDPQNDLNGDGSTDEQDLDYMVRVLLRTSAGDANVDGFFDSNDLIQVFQIGEYEDDIAGNSRWSEGDWNCDGDFDSNDLVTAFQAGTYSLNSRPRRGNT